MTHPEIDLLAQAKARLPLPALMALLGHGEHAKKSARCPFHDDSRNSFSVWQRDDGGWRFKCHAGCGEGDEPDYLAKKHGLSNADACREYIRLAGVIPSRPHPNLDKLDDHLQILSVQIGAKLLISYFPQTPKGQFTFEYFELNEIQTNSFTGGQGGAVQTPSETMPLEIMQQLRDVVKLLEGS